MENRLRVFDYIDYNDYNKRRQPYAVLDSPHPLFPYRSQVSRRFDTVFFRVASTDRLMIGAVKIEIRFCSHRQVFPAQSHGLVINGWSLAIPNIDLVTRGGRCIIHVY